MGGGLAFRLSGIPVRIEPTFFLLALFLGLGARSGGLLVAWVAIVTGSVLLHEVGHALAFRRYGQRPHILLQGLGGLTSGSGEPLTPARDLVVSLAGPLTGLVLLGLPALALRRSDTDLSPTLETVVADVVFVNLAWSVLNLLPVLPLDGGRVSAALWSLFTGGEGRRQAHLLSAAVAAAAGAYAFLNGYLFGAMFAAFFCAYNVRELSAARDHELFEQLAAGWRALADGRPDGAAATAEGVLASAPSAPVMAQAKQLLGWARLAGGDGPGARAALEPFPPGLQPDPLLLAALALEDGDSAEALDRLVAAYREQEVGPAAPLVADAAARAGLHYPLLDRLLADGGPGAGAAALLAVHLHTAGRYEEAVEAGHRALEAGGEDGEGRGRVAYNLACSHARAGHEDAALDWLDRAAALGFADLALLDGDPDLDPLRERERFRAIRRRLAPDA